MKKEEKHYTKNLNKKQTNEIQDLLFGIDEAFFEKENHRKKREINRRKKQEKRRREDKWN